jgi:diguanylate cyclase (GGDEF)-like protein
MTLKPSRHEFAIPVIAVMRLTIVMLLLAALAEAQLSSIGSHWWNSGWFWAVIPLLIAITAAMTWRSSERSHIWRKSTLERTADLDRESRRERERNHILEMLVSNEPLGTVLDALINSIRSQCPDALCAILLKRGDGCHVAAHTDVPGEWLAALRVPHAVPFEVWSIPLSNRHPSSDPVWKDFASQLTKGVPGVICSRPIFNVEGQPGVILLFYGEGTEHAESDARVAETSGRIARLAIEKSHLYDSLQFQAHHDSLTGLSNRALFEERLERSMREANTLGQRLAVLFVDLDRFKQVNDTFSHRVGDLFLCEIARRMKGALRPADTVARIGGDEFTIVLNEVKDVSEAAEIAGRVLNAIRQPLVIDGHELDARASVGIAIFPDDGADAEKLQRAADAAMYCAKDLGGDHAEIFSTRHEILDRVRMDEELRIALREGYFVVHYQPKVGADRQLAGLEALVRMNHPEHGQIPPMSFIPVAESNGLMVPIGAWVLDEVCRQIAAWESRGLRPVSVAVNVSPVQICRPDFARFVGDCLRRHGVASSSLELELTESLLINAAGVAQEQLQALRVLGVKLSIDDFGTGFSSLSYLHRLPVDAIKLDKSFVQSIDTDHLAQRLVHAMIGVAQSFGLNVIAEGVETENQRDALLSSGCSLMQGFLFAHPLPAVELEEFLRAPCVAVVPACLTSASGNDLLQLTASLHLDGGRIKEPAVA